MSNICDMFCWVVLPDQMVAWTFFKIITSMQRLTKKGRPCSEDNDLDMLTHTTKWCITPRANRRSALNIDEDIYLIKHIQLLYLRKT